MKTCSNCDGDAVLRGLCRPCYNAYQRAYWANRSDRSAPTSKRCKACNLEKPAAEFPKSGNKGSGLRARCKACEIAQRRRRHIDTPERFQSHYAVIDERTGETVKACSQCDEVKPAAAYYRLGDGRIRSACKACEAKNSAAAYTRTSGRKRAYAPRPGQTREQMLEKQRAYNSRRVAIQAAYTRHRLARMTTEERERHAAIMREGRRRYAKAHAGIHAAKEKRRRARKAGAPIVEIIDRDAIVLRDASICYLWCGRVLTDDEITLDHVVPLARGGWHAADNLRVACRLCNSRKGTRLLGELNLL